MCARPILAVLLMHCKFYITDEYYNDVQRNLKNTSLVKITMVYNELQNSISLVNITIIMYIEF